MDGTTTCFARNTAHLSNVIPVNRASVYAARAFAAEGRRFDMQGGGQGIFFGGDWGQSGGSGAHGP